MIGDSKCQDLFFGDRTSWFDHELLHHRSHFTCMLCNQDEFDSRQSAESHISSIHGSFLNATQLALLIDSGKKIPNHFKAKDYPFCDSWATAQEVQLKPKGKGICDVGNIVVTATRFKRHVATHLEQLAIFVLPKPDQESENDEFGNDEGNVYDTSPLSKSLYPGPVEATSVDSHEYIWSPDSRDDNVGVSYRNPPLDPDEVEIESERSTGDLFIMKHHKDNPLKRPDDMFTTLALPLQYVANTAEQAVTGGDIDVMSPAYQPHLGPHNSLQPLQKGRLVKCPQCPQVFTTNRDLRIHEIGHDAHPRTDFPCEYCGQRFTRNDNLKVYFYNFTFPWKFDLWAIYIDERSPLLPLYRTVSS